jgi:hypothetical protein
MVSVEDGSIVQRLAAMQIAYHWVSAAVARRGSAKRGGSHYGYTMREIRTALAKPLASRTDRARAVVLRHLLRCHRRHNSTIPTRDCPESEADGMGVRILDCARSQILNILPR